MKSIRNLVVLSFSILLVFLTLSLSVFFLLGTLQDRAHQAFLEKNEAMLMLSRTVSHMNVLSSTMLRASSAELVADYQKAMLELEQEISTVRSIPEVDGELKEVLRRLSNFNEYQYELVKDASVSAYDKFTYIRDSVIQHQMAVEELVLELYTRTSNTFASYEKRLSTIEYSFWILLVTSLVFMIFSAIRAAKRILLQMQQIQSAAHRLAANDWSTPDIPGSGFLEFDELAVSMNRMKREILQYLQQLEQQALKEKELGDKLLEAEQQEKYLIQAQLANLRAQINPHFLFNALDIIGKVAFLNDPELAMELIEAVSKILRYSLDATDVLVPLADELSVIKQYLLLQQVRFGERVTIEYVIETLAEQARMPAMILQPLIENCFKHGMKTKTDLHIRIEAALVGSDLSLIIEDSGEGFDPAVLPNATSHIGLQNVSTRLHLRYKREGLFSIESEKHSHTIVRLTIPQGEEIA
ncbi:MAG: sensor histidine kinase [Sphaerochaeta sp.]|jgi:sensor histidine kinase YesM|uniref:sensor histidine kinase n=1 Tax=Sphaerochaeta sp. TaxID=1972642 RepID=UPI003D11B005